MKIAGFQKLSLVDYPGRCCATIFTPSCTFRCPFCHNSNIAFTLSGNTGECIDTAEVLDVLKKRKALLDGVCISGGEPTLQKDLIDFIKLLKDMGYSVKLDTNGNSPEVLEKIVSEHLVDYVAMDIKSAFSQYGRAVGLVDFSTANVEKSAALLMSGDTDYEFRTTIVEQLHTPECIEEMARNIRDAKLWRLQKFEQSENVPDGTLTAISNKRLAQIFEKIEIKPENIIYY